MWVATHFSEKKTLKYKECTAIFFVNLSSLIISEKCAVTPIFFLDSDSSCYDLFFPHGHEPRKKIVVLVGKFLKKPEYGIP